MVRGEMVEAERNLSRIFWLRWRKEKRQAENSKKRSRNGIPVPRKTTSMGPPDVPSGRKGPVVEPRRAERLMEQTGPVEPKMMTEDRRGCGVHEQDI